MCSYCIYDVGFKKAWWSHILFYLLIIPFLIDFYLTWQFNQAKLRGDNATNISSLPARVLRLVGAICSKKRKGSKPPSRKQGKESEI